MSLPEDLKDWDLTELWECVTNPERVLYPERFSD